eukprot:TRINITY_DN23512_c0_g1_i1.p1 TRINITY_DN23512_c0_g1~~TRINITY_DN23512_c0_g1_i1.p1  ORF type:complete len:127 (-),score=49.54 TRINITY_DN23512_c0_g1_i1:57-380(-)
MCIRDRKENDDIMKKLQETEKDNSYLKGELQKSFDVIGKTETMNKELEKKLSETQKLVESLDCQLRSERKRDEQAFSIQREEKAQAIAQTSVLEEQVKEGELSLIHI